GASAGTRSRQVCLMDQRTFCILLSANASRTASMAAFCIWNREKKKRRKNKQTQAAAAAATAEESSSSRDDNASVFNVALISNSDAAVPLLICCNPLQH